MTTTEATRTETATRLDSLTGLRFFAAFLVFGYHAQRYGTGPGIGLFDAGMTGVSFFFIVSGFVLTWSASPGTTSGTFWMRRFARIYPAFVAAWLVTLALLVATGGGIASTDFFALTLVQTWVPDSDFYFAANTVFWSLSCEAFFYAVFPLLIRAMRPLAVGSLATLALVCMITTLGLAVLADAVIDAAPPVWVTTIFPPARLPEFVLGMALALLIKQRGTSGWPTWASPALMFAVATAAVYAAGFAPTAYSRAAVTLIPFSLLVCSAAVADVTSDGSWLRHRWLVELGAWSYCLYLIHAEVLAVWNIVLTRLGATPDALSASGFLGAVTVGLVASVLAAWLLHVAVERPFERRLRPAGRSRVD